MVITTLYSQKVHCAAPSRQRSQCNEDIRKKLRRILRSQKLAARHRSRTRRESIKRQSFLKLAKRLKKKNKQRRMAKPPAKKRKMTAKTRRLARIKKKRVASKILLIRPRRKSRRAKNKRNIKRKKLGSNLKTR